MISRCSTRRLRQAAAGFGFTLLEMLVVVAILSFLLVLVVGYRPPWSKGLDIDATAAGLASQLRLVRSAAIAGNRAVALEFDLTRHRYSLGTATPRLLPPELSLQLLTIAGERQSAGIGGIRFNPDGSSTGGRILLNDGTRSVAVGIDWLTGNVSITDVR